MGDFRFAVEVGICFINELVGEKMKLALYQRRRMRPYAAFPASCLSQQPIIFEMSDVLVQNLNITNMIAGGGETSLIMLQANLAELSERFTSIFGTS